jgi:cytochrome c553
MPAVVQGKAGGTDACGYCHMPNGAGRPENAALAGLPAAYLVQQVLDMQSGLRLPLPHFTASQRMLDASRRTTVPELAAAARYYSQVRYIKRLRVIETVTVPHFAINGVYLFDSDGPPALLGQRIVEGPDDNQRFAMRDDRVTYRAYVPIGSVSRGDEIAGGEGAHAPCSSCHGDGLKGAAAPALAGRSPTVTFRQLYAFQNDFRSGKNTAPMKAIVSGRSIQDLIALSAYAASLSP